MGHTIWVDVQGRPADETPGDSSIMLRLMEKLDVLADKLHVPQLSAFYDYTELDKAYGAPTAEGDGIGSESASIGRQVSGSWFEAADGLKSIKALRQRLSENFAELDFTADRSKGHWPGALMDELRSAEAILERATAKNQRFRFLIVP